MNHQDLNGMVEMEGPTTETFNPVESAPDGWVCLRCRLRETTAPLPDGGDEVQVRAVNRSFMPITDEDTGGFDGRYGTWTPNDLTTGEMADYQPDMKDQLSNRPLGNNGPYEIYGTTVESSDMPGGTWAPDGDLTIGQAIAWQRARGNATTADRLEYLKTQLEL